MANSRLKPGRAPERRTELARGEFRRSRPAAPAAAVPDGFGLPPAGHGQQAAAPRSTIRPCGKRWDDEESARRSKRYLQGGYQVAKCPLRDCGGVHLDLVQQAQKRTLVAPMGSLHPFPAAACAVIDLRDAWSLDVAVPERMCQRCGATGVVLHRHHRRGKGSGGSEDRPHTHCVCNSVTLCASDHFWAHSLAPRQAMAEGFIVSQAVKVPALAEVIRFAASGGEDRWWPTCGGKWAREAPEGSEAA